MTIGHLITCQHLGKWQGEGLFYTCGRAQQTLISSQRLRENIFSVKSSAPMTVLSPQACVCGFGWLAVLQ